LVPLQTPCTTGCNRNGKLLTAVPPANNLRTRQYFCPPLLLEVEQLAKSCILPVRFLELGHLHTQLGEAPAHIDILPSQITQFERPIKGVEKGGVGAGKEVVYVTRTVDARKTRQYRARQEQQQED